MNALQAILWVVIVAVTAGAAYGMYIIFGLFGAALTVVMTLIAAAIAIALAGGFSGGDSGSGGGGTSYQSKGAREE